MVMDLPTRNEIAEVVRGLLSGALTRGEASAWAEPWVTGNARIADSAAWSALKLLAAADLVSTDRPHLYEAADYEACLTELGPDPQ